MTKIAPEARPGLRDRAKAERMRRIRDAAKELFVSNGYEHTTTKQIAEVAEVGEATLFRYVANKRDLLLLVLGEKMDETIAEMVAKDGQLERSTKTAQDFVNRLQTIYQARASFYAKDPENVLSYLQQGLTVGSKLGDESIRQGDQVITLTQKILDQAKEKGHLIQSIDTRIVAQNCNGIYIHEVLRTPVRHFNPVDMATRLHARIAAQIEPLFPTLHL